MFFLAFEKYNGFHDGKSFGECKPSLASLDSLWKGMDDPKKTVARVEAIVTIELPEVDFQSQAASKREADEKRCIVIFRFLETYVLRPFRAAARSTLRND